MRIVLGLLASLLFAAPAKAQTLALPSPHQLISEISTLTLASKTQSITVPQDLADMYNKKSNHPYIYMVDSDEWVLFLKCDSCGNWTGEYKVTWDGKEAATSNWPAAWFNGAIPKHADLVAPNGNRYKATLLYAQSRTPVQMQDGRKIYFGVGQKRLGIGKIDAAVLNAKVLGVHCNDYDVDSGLVEPAQCQYIINDLRDSGLGLIVRNCPTIMSPQTEETSVRCLPKDDADIMLYISEDYDPSDWYQPRTFFVSAYAGKERISIGGTFPFNEVNGLTEFHSDDSLSAQVASYLVAQGAPAKQGTQR